MPPVPLDEYPVHQAPLSMQYAASTDRNFYDRYYFNGHDRTGRVFFISGFGIYPNLGVRDGFLMARLDDQQHTVRCSDALDDRGDRLHPSVGPYRIEVIEPLRKIRIVCEGDGLGVQGDLTWEGSFDTVEEQHHVMRTGNRPILDACRFAQVGSWSGTLHVGGEDFTLDPDVWMGTRDRSWGIRPVGEAEPGGRAAAEGMEGFWWLYVPLRFEEFAVVVIIQEQPDGFRTLNDATRVWKDGRVEQLGWPRFDIVYRPGTRHPERATLHLTEPTGKPLDIEVETLGHVVLHAGAGYGGDPDWNHGRWMGPNWVDQAVYDMNDPGIQAMAAFGVIDHVGKATCNGEVGWGLFEHGTMGRHDPSGFADWGSTA